MYDYIIYHGNCIDGFAGFYLFIKSKQWKPKPIIFCDQPHSKKLPPNIDNKNVIIIDVAYDAKLLEQIIKRTKSMLFIDHHKSNIEEINKLKLDEEHKIFYDETHSGASLVWKYFFGDYVDMPIFIKYIEDNDIGNWIYEETIPFITSIQVEFKLTPDFENLKIWDKLLDEKFNSELIERGKVYNKYKDHLIHSNAKRNTILYFPSKKIVNLKLKGLNKIGKYKVAVVNGGCPNTSLLGKYVVEKYDCDFSLIWHYVIEKNNYVVSLRSNNVDVSIIAKSLGGGGHKFASAFSFKSNEKFLGKINITSIDDLFSI